ILRRDPALHPPRLPLPGDRPAVDQLPPAPLDPPDAGRGLDRARPDQGRLRPRRRLRLSLFLLRRRVPDRGSVMSLGFEILARDGAARTGRLTTAHGAIDTPAFMPIGTAGSVKAMTPEGVAATGARIVLGNTYHLMLRPRAP